MILNENQQKDVGMEWANKVYKQALAAMNASPSLQPIAAECRTVVYPSLLWWDGGSLPANAISTILILCTLLACTISISS